MFTRTWRSIVLIAGEAVLLVIAVAVSSYLRIGDETWTMLSTAAGVSSKPSSKPGTKCW